ncbi:hypothetical protein E2C01_024960 [Portunus trituberculatus]|uniref:Uncharacterized protein n=1 Tax=Portunus trituberculatus TaxID=210409 RepID=A0A5B7EGK9_PORTR|nr:hypothetical protein [Portunus trituberculatus]
MTCCTAPPAAVRRVLAGSGAGSSVVKLASLPAWLGDLNQGAGWSEGMADQGDRAFPQQRNSPYILQWRRRGDISQVTTVLDAAEVEGGGVRRVCGSGANWLVVLIVSLFGAPRGSVCRMIGLSDCGWVKLRV